MRATHSVESVMGSRSRVRVLRVLNGVRVPLNASQIASRAGLSQPAVVSALGDLAAMGMVESSPAGRATVHWLVRENVFVETIVAPAFAAERSIPEAIVRDLERVFAGKTESVVLFGAFARGEDGEKSEVGVALVVHDAAGKAEIEAAAAAYAPEFRRRFGATLAPRVYDLAEASSLGEREPEFAKAIEKDGVVVSGLPPLEWRPSGGDLEGAVQAASEPVLEEVVRRLVAVYSPDRVYLFGSSARGERNEDSDYDIMVVVSDDAPAESRRAAKGYDALWGVGVPVDVVVWTRTEFDRRLHLKASLPATVVREGILLHVAA